MLIRPRAPRPRPASPRARRPLLGALGAALLAAAPALVASPAAAARRERGRPQAPSLPQSSVLSNLRSVTGRTIYLLLRPAPGEIDGLRERAERVAQAASAKVRVRAAGPLWIAVLEHKDRGLDVHRQGRDLLIDEGPLGSLDDALSAGVRLWPGRSDSDLDQEILLQARNVMRDREEVPQRLVALAQAAAARQVLLRYVSGDDVGAATWGRRYLPLLSQHPDAGLLKELVTFAWDGLTVPVPAEPPRIAQSAAAPPQWSAALTSAAGSASAARRLLSAPPKVEVPGDEAEEGKGEGKDGKARGRKAEGKERKKRGEAKAAEVSSEAAGKAEAAADKPEKADKAAEKADKAAEKADKAAEKADKATEKAGGAHKAEAAHEAPADKAGHKDAGAHKAEAADAGVPKAPAPDKAAGTGNHKAPAAHKAEE